MQLPPGQRAVEGFPRFGAHLSRPVPDVPDVPQVEVRGAVRAPFCVPVADLAALPRRAMTADFHCVTGWSAVGLQWEGVPFGAFYRAVVEPALVPGAVVTHLVLRGLDGYRSVLTLEDALAEDVLLADRLDGAPLPGEHGAPVRVVSPRQYGYVSTKHLSRIEVCTAEPVLLRRSRLDRLVMSLISAHPRARVWQEERHRHLPAWLVRLPYRATIGPVARRSARG